MSTSKKETDFIRGKSGNEKVGLKTKVNKPKVSSSDDQLFEVRKRKSNFGNKSDENGAKTKRKKTKNRSEDSNEDTDKVVIESMSLTRLPEGIVIYGCIEEMSDFDLKLSICGGIVAKVSITNISNSYTLLLQSFAQNESISSSDVEVLKPNGMFKIGQYFPIKILSKSKKTKGFANIDITASMNPRDIYSDLMVSSLLKVNQMPIIAAVDSVEDHGFVMDIGFDGIKAFLPIDSAQTAIQIFKGRKSLSVGQLVLCAIESVANERSVRLTTKAKTLSKFKLTTDKDVGISCLFPGLKVSTTVMNVSERGLELNILNDFKGFVNRNHLKNDWELPKNMYSIGDKVDGTVLYKHPITKQIAVSFKSNLDSKGVKSFLQNVKIGAIYERAVVMGRDGIGNVVFKLSNGVKAIAPKKHLLDKESDDLDLDVKYAIGSEHKCRVKSINLMDGLVVVTLRKSMLDSPSVSVDDLKIGTLLRGKVKRVTKNGAVIQIGFGLKGFVPNHHLAETAEIKNREQLFPKGKVVKCRVFKMDKSCTPCRVNLTAKKSLTNKKHKILSSYEEAIRGFETDGVVVLIVKSGILIEFFNEVKGFVPLKYLSSYRIDDLEKVFKIGQMVRCSVVSTNVEKERITCSLNKLDDKTKNSNLRVGQVLAKMKITNKSNNGFDLVNESGDCNVIMPFGHLSDDIEMSYLLSEALSVGDVIEEVVVFTVKSNVIIVSKKQTFINCAKNNNLIVSIKQLEPNLIIPVIINGFTTYGIFVEMAGNIKGLVPKRYLIDGPIDEPNKLGFALHQTVFARFIEFEEQKNALNEKERKKLAFSLKLSHVWHRETDPFEDRVELFRNFINEYDLAIDLFENKSNDNISHFRIGQIVFYRVVEANDSQIICDVKPENHKKYESVKGIAMKCESDLDKEFKVGASGIAVVVDIDFTDKSVQIMIRQKLVKQVKNSYKINAISSIKCEQIIKCQPIYVCNKFVLVVLSGHAPGLIAYIPAKRHLNDIHNISSLFSLNEFYHIIIKSISNNKVIGVLKSEIDKYHSNRVHKIKYQLEAMVELNDSKSGEENKEESHSEKENDKSEPLETRNTKRKRNSNSESDNKQIETKLKLNLMTQSAKKLKADVLKVDEPFVWNVEPTPDLNRLDLLTTNQISSDSESDESDSEDEKTKTKKTRQERNEESRLREEELRKTEELLMDSERKPETADDFERAVLASPNSSMVWLKYMAFYLEQTEVGKARAVAERAIKSISFREEREKLNVWVALLNLENLYGTQKTLDDVFERALQFNEPVVIYTHLANIYSQSDKPELAEALFHTMTKKFRQNKNVWISFGLFYIRTNRLESARRLMQRSLTCLEKRDHIEVISKFAQMEFKSGDVEHGKTLFENVLANFPKRIDLWSVYIDMMLKYTIKDDNKESVDSVRNIFERIITFKLSPKRMKFIFKRYMDFEKQFNNEDRIDRIKQKALEYVDGNGFL